MWLSVALISYFLMAMVQLVERFLLVKAIPNPFSYTFYVGTFGLLTLALIPFTFLFIGASQVLIALSSGIIFGMGLIVFYEALRVGEASRVVPIVGGLVAAFTFILARIFLGELLGLNEVIAFAFLIIGGLLISLRLEKKKPIIYREWLLILSAAVFFSLAWVLKKEVFLSAKALCLSLYTEEACQYAPFLNGLIWFGVGGFLFALFLLVFPKIRREIFTRTPKIETKNKLLFLGNQGVSGIAVLLRNVAVYLGSVSLVNAMEGIQYAFMLLFAFILAKNFPQILKEEFRGVVIWQKIVAILFIGFGLFLLSGIDRFL